MNLSISNEVYILLWSVFAGICIAAFFDLFRTLRKAVKSGIFISGIQDILFWLIASAIMFFVVFYVANGRVRWYQFFGAFLGSVLYFLVFSKPIMKVLNCIIKKIYQIFDFFFKILLTPLRFMYRIIYVSLSFFLKPVIKLFKNCARVLNMHTHKYIKRMQLLFTKR